MLKQDKYIIQARDDLKRVGDSNRRLINQNLQLKREFEEERFLRDLLDTVQTNRRKMLEQRERLPTMRKFQPLQESHPLVGEDCPVCKDSFKAGNETTLITLWPADPEEAKKAQEGRPYTAEARAVHWKCRGGQ